MLLCHKRLDVSSLRSQFALKHIHLVFDTTQTRLYRSQGLRTEGQLILMRTRWGRSPREFRGPLWVISDIRFSPPNTGCREQFPFHRARWCQVLIADFPISYYSQAQARTEVCVVYFRVQTSSSHTTLHSQSHVGAPINGSSTPQRRHPLVMS